MATGSVTETGLSSLKSARNWCLRYGELSPHSTFWMDALNPENYAAPPPATSTCASAASSARTPSRTPHLSEIVCPPWSLCGCLRGRKFRPKDQCLADLVQIGLYLCLRLCEYTKTNSRRRTTQFRLRDILFQDACGAIPLDSPASRFLNALVVILFLDTQKYSIRVNSISMDLTCLLLGCPVVACTCCFLCLHDNGPNLDTPVCVYFEHKGAARNPSPESTWCPSIGFGLATLDLLYWGSTHTKLALTTCVQAAP